MSVWVLCCCLWLLPHCHIWCEAQKGAQRTSDLDLPLLSVVSADKSEADAASGRSPSPCPSPSSSTPS